MAKNCVVVVEDDAMVNAVLVELLRDAGYDVVALPDAAGALGALPGDVAAVLVTDIQLPGDRQGEQLALEWERSGPRRRAVLITGSLELPDTPLPLLAKPFGLSRLIPTVRSLFAEMAGEARPG